MNPHDSTSTPKGPEEECRSLQEFFPDPEIRKGLHYSFAHRILAKKFFHDPTAFFRSVLWGFAGDGARDDTRWIQAQFVGYVYMVVMSSKLDCGWNKRRGTFARVTDLRMDVVSLGGLPLALVKMPEPEFHPCAHFVGIVAPSPTKLDQPGNDSDARYFTLEQAAPHLP